MFRLKGRTLSRFVASVCITSLIAGALASGSVVTAEAGKGPAAKVTVYADGSEWEYVTCRQTVKDVLKETGISLESKDRVMPKLSSRVKPGAKIKVIRIKEEIITKSIPIPYKTITKFDNGSSIQPKTIVRKGEAGAKTVKMVVVYKDGVKCLAKTLSSKVVKAPVNEIVAISKSRFLASRAGMRLPSMRMKASAYDPGPRSCGPRATGRTANGTKAGYGVVAVDPRVIPLGTKLYVEGYGFCIAADTGGAIKGNRIDLCYETYREAKNYGRRTVTVYIIK
ncbi:MAG: 3D domain-containing protein [Armatimonadota bacterium]